MANISGWYYDEQLKNKLTSISLHANMIYKEETDEKTGKKKLSWSAVPVMTSRDENAHVADREDDGFAGTNDKGEQIYYDRVPICQSICSEDFAVNISNDWSDFGVDNIGGQLWNGLRQIGPYKSVIGSALQPMIDEAKRREAKYQKDETNGTRHSWTDRMNHAIDWVATRYDTYFGKMSQADYFNKALIMQGTKFSYYGGSNVNFTNLGMRFTLFPKLENGTYISVLDQAEDLYKYFIGSIENFDWGEAGNYIDETTKKYLMWQKAPIDFTPNLQDYDVIQQGTLKLKIGSLYAIPNLVCNDANFVFSKQMVKFPSNFQSPDSKTELSPLFCDVTLSLRPVSKYSERMLRSLVNKDRKTHTKAESKVSESLEKEIETIKKNYNV